jgi:hypothetical protein
VVRRRGGLVLTPQTMPPESVVVVAHSTVTECKPNWIYLPEKYALLLSLVPTWVS